MGLSTWQMALQRKGMLESIHLSHPSGCSAVWLWLVLRLRMAAAAAWRSQLLSTKDVSSHPHHIWIPTFQQLQPLGLTEGMRAGWWEDRLRSHPVPLSAAELGTAAMLSPACPRVWWLLGPKGITGLNPLTHIPPNWARQHFHRTVESELGKSFSSNLLL